MAYADQVFENLFNEHLNNLHTCMPCMVVEYYPGEMKADIEPLFQRKKGGETSSYPMIEKVPVVRSLLMCTDPKGECECGHYMELEPGMKVLVQFAERALDQVGTRRHDLRDAIITAVM